VNYLPGKGSRKKPRVFFVTTAEEFIEVCRNCPPDMMCAVGVNLRPDRINTFAKNEDIELVQNFYLDIEVSRTRKWGEAVNTKEKEDVRTFISSKLLSRLKELGFQRPKVCDSGSFFHVYFAVPPIKTTEHPDTSERLKAFFQELRDHFADELKAKSIKIDGTHDPRRLAKVAGTAKPGGDLSDFDQDATRLEDEKLRAHLLSLKVALKAEVEKLYLTEEFKKEAIPEAFTRTLATDEKLKKTFDGKRDDMTDNSRSGHDLSLLAQTIKLDIRDPKKLAVIIYNAPYNAGKWKGLRAKGTLRYIEQTVNKALSSAKDKEVMRVVSKEFDAKFSYGSLEYQIKSWERKSDGIRATIYVRHKEKEGTHTDALSLWLSRQRTEFAKNVNARWSTVEVDSIKEHLIEIQTKLLERAAEEDKRHQEEAKRISEGQSSAPTIPDALKESALQTLQDPDLMEIIIEDLETLGHVGERTGKQLIYLAATSRLLENPINVLIQGRSSAGKSNMGETVFKLFPPEAVIDATSFSEQALVYAGQCAFKHKVVSMAEHIDTESNNQVYYYLRELMSKGKVTRYLTMASGEGSMSAVPVTAEGPIAFVETTTKLKINEENATRMFVYRIDESEELTKKIHKEHRRAVTEEGIRLKASRERVIKRHHAMQRLLRARKVIIPFANEIEFPTVLRSRRDHKRFISLICASTLLHQFQRTEREVDGNRVIEANGVDYKIAWNIANDILADSIFDVPAPALELYELLKKAKKEKKLPKQFTKKSVGKALGKDWSESRIHRTLNELAIHEYVKIITEGRGPKPHVFELEKEDVEREAGIPGLSELAAKRMKRPGFWKDGRHLG
jgi:hypothetical protein